MWRSNPQISVYNYNGSTVIGDSLYIVRIGGADQDTIQIASMVNGQAVYEFGKPVFSQERNYALAIQAFEEYSNSDDPANIINDKVPVTDGKVIIINECANNSNQRTFGLNEDGFTLYEFFGGLPNLSNPFTKKLEIKLKVGDNYYNWENSPTDAYVSGNLPTGNNFVTTGPDKIDFVLRDPPGSESYSYMEKGLVINYTKTTTTNKAWEGSENATFHMGNKITTSSGTPFFAVDLELEITRDIALGFEHSNDWGNEHETNNQVAFNQVFSTSSDPAYVGDMGDVFLGHSTNIIFGASDFIQIIPLADVPTDAETLNNVTIEGEDYTICKKKGLFLGNEFATTFIYSQNHIINYLIPNLLMLRNAVYDNNSEYYTLRITDSEDEKFLSNNDDEFVWGDEASDDKFDGPSYVFYNENNDDLIDSVRHYNNQIIAWQKVLSDNEYQKLKSEPYEDQFPKNISFDAGAAYEASVTTDSTETYTDTYEWMVSPSLATELGFTANNKGVTFEMEQKYVHTKNTSTSNDTTETQTIGFVLEDGDQGDYYSVNIRKDEKGGYGPIFRTQGGQSSCPYEGASFTNYYKPGTFLNQATMQVEVPAISVDNNIVAGVPETEPAIFKVGLSNNSEVDADVWYTVLLDASTNPDGAIVAMDGVPISASPKSILVRSGQTVYKTLTVLKGQQDVNEYDSIAVIMHSACQFDPTDDVDNIADTVYISAHFTPTCTAVNFNKIYDQWTANTSNNDTLSFSIEGYNLNNSKFKTISFQYATPGSPRTSNMVFYKDETDFNNASEPKTWINTKTSIDYNFALGNLNDGTYQIYLKSMCNDGTEYLTPPLIGIIDRVTPRPFGNPEPGDGILSPGEDISILFNEEINSGDLYSHADYIEVRGIPNGTDLKDNSSLLHDANIQFDGVANSLIVRNGMNLNQTSFTIEFWAKRSRLGRECLLSMGSLAEGIWIGFNEENKFVFSLGTDAVVSETAYDALDEWMHFACVYNMGDEQTEAAIMTLISTDASTEDEYLETTSFTALEAMLYVGYCPEDASSFMGSMHELRIWNIYRTAGDISSKKSQILSGYEQGLYGLWPLNDASGNYATDKAFGKNAEVNATWQVSRKGKAATFDGMSYATAPAGNMIFNNQANFTIELWFKAQQTGSNMCMLSNGKSDGTMGRDAWTITIKDNNFLEVMNNGVAIAFNASDYLDNNWQHFAVSVDRLGYISLYMNGELVKTASGKQFEGFAASYLTIGARWWYHEQTDYYDSYFSGVIDEIRIWNTVRKQSQISRYKNHALSCDEFSLKAYYPFEDVRNPDPSVSNATLENLTEEENAVAGNLSFVINATYTSECPNIKLQRPEVSLPFDYIINKDRVIITPSMDDADIENVILDISVKKVKDLNNNEMASTANWTAFVDKNQLTWDVQELSCEKFIEDEHVLTAIVSNKGGVSENYEITNIPDWLGVSPQYGVLNPRESQEIILTVKPVLNIGKYSRDINVVSSMGFNERLNLKAKVKAHEPDWSFNPEGFEFTANLIGELKIDNVLSTDTDDKVGAFVNGECRGTAYVQYFPIGNLYLLYMDIYSNKLSEEEITFKVFDASTGEVYADVSPKLDFVANSLYGSIDTPTEINAANGIEQTLTLNKGWTWVSLNVDNPNSNDLNMVLNDMQAVQGDVIKGKDAYAQFPSTGIWSGTLSSLNYKEMYKINAENAHSFIVTGAKVISDTVDIPIVEGWNWIGYPSQKQIRVKEAMSSINPSDEDIIKSQQKFAIYKAANGWIGSLDYLIPGRGYMFKSANAGFITISGGYKSKGLLIDDESMPDIIVTASNMTMIAEIANNNNYTLSAFANGELSGYATPVNVNGKALYFITINGKPNSEITFSAENSSAHYNANEKFVFTNNAHKGTIDAPVQLTFAKTEINVDNNGVECRVFPNPFTNKLSVKLLLSENENIQFEIYNVLGMKMFESNKQKYAKGVHSIDISDFASSLKDGIYLLKIKTSKTTKVINIVKQ